MRKKFIYLIGSILLLFHITTVNAQQKPNVIFISVDDLSICFSAYNNPEVPTPNIDRLASHGTLFKTAYCQYSLCSPSRTSSLSGQRPDDTQVFDNKMNPRKNLGNNFRFLPEFFHDYGYRTERFGKFAPCSHETSISWDWGSTIRDDHYKVEGVPYWWIDTINKTEGSTYDAKVTAEMIGRMKNPVAEPYFYGYGLSTHNPFKPILENWNKLGDSTVQENLKIDMEGNFSNLVGNGSGNILLPDAPVDDVADIPSPALKNPIIYPNDEWKRMRHAYYSEIIQLDDILGNLLDELDRSNAWENSIIIFTSDHGVQLGEHGGQWLKQTLFEETLRVPLIICAPGMKKGVVCERPVELVDLFATLNELSGLPAPPNNQGSSLVPLLQNPDAIWKPAVFSQVERTIQQVDIMGRCVRNENFSYSNWGEYGEELYDIVNDPYQYTNLALMPAYNTQLNQMRALLTGNWQGALPPNYQKQTFYQDNDGDGYGSSITTNAYFAPDGYTSTTGDCDDNNPKVHPTAFEKYCNGIDDNCNGEIDETKPSPTIFTLGNLDICQAGSVVLQTKALNAFNIQWKKDGNNIQGANSKKYTATEAGSYSVEVSYRGCNSISETLTVINSCGKINSGRDNALATTSTMFIYPSPSNGNVTINYVATTSGNTQVKIIDMAGKTVHTSNQYVIKGSNTLNFNFTSLNSGVYFIQLKNENQILKSKLVIEK